MTIDRKQRNIDYIKAHPELSGNECYEYAKNNGFGIQKKSFYQLFRSLRKLPEPTEIKKESSVPIKYKKEKRFIGGHDGKLPIPIRDAQYGVVEVQDLDDDKRPSFWIKYETQKDYERQLNKIMKSNSTFCKRVKITFKNIYNYTSFIDEEFESLLLADGISIR